MHNTFYGITTFLDKPGDKYFSQFPGNIDVSRRIAWWQYFYIVPLCLLFVAFVIFAVFFYILFPIQLLQIVPYLLMFAIL